MVSSLNKEVLSKVDEIINYIENSCEYKKYLLLKEKISSDREINTLLDEIRHLQKVLANNYSLKNKEALDKKNDQLKCIPLYREYLNTLDEINNIFNIIENGLNKYFTEKLN